MNGYLSPDEVIKINALLLANYKPYKCSGYEYILINDRKTRCFFKSIHIDIDKKDTIHIYIKRGY